MNKESLFEQDKTEADNQAVSIKDILIKYINYSWLFILLSAVSFAIAWGYLRYATPRYNVAATLMIRNDNPRAGGQAGDAMFSSLMLMQSATNKQNEIQIMQSRSMLLRVVKTLGLSTQYYVVGKVKTSSIYKESPIVLEILNIKDSMTAFSMQVKLKDNGTFRLGEQGVDYRLGEPFSNAQGTFSLKLNEKIQRNPEYDTYIVNYVPEYAAAMQLLSALSVLPAKDNSNVVNLSMVTDNPTLGADVLNTLMVEYNAAAVEDKNETNHRVIGFLDDRLRIVENQLDSVERDLMQFKTAGNIIDIAAQSSFYFENLGVTANEIREQEIRLNVVSLLEDYIKDPKNRANLVPSTLGIDDPALVGLVTAYNELLAKKTQELQTGARPDGAVVGNLDKNIEEVRVKMLKALGNVRLANASALKKLESQNAGFKNEIAAIPSKEKGARQIARQQEIKQSLYLFLLQKKEESSIALASTIANARVLDPALNIRKKVSPTPAIIYLMALAAGLIIPILIILLIDLFNDKVTTRNDITRNTQAPIVAEIGHSDNSNVLLFGEQTRSVIAEQLRILRTNLQFLMGDKMKTSTILVTSSFSGEGKSFVSTNLAGAMAISGKKTVILEFDLRKPKIMTGLGLNKAHGLTNFLVGSMDLEDLIIPVKSVPNLFVIPCGPVPPNPSEILLSPNTEKLFSWLKDNFDVVVIDSAPVGLVSDGVTLSAFADMTLYVVRQRYTFKKQLLMIDELYRQKKLPKMGILVNDVIAEGAKGYYGYGAGRYGYGYGYGYAGLDEKDAKRKKGWRRFLPWKF